MKKKQDIMSADAGGISRTALHWLAWVLILGVYIACRFHIIDMPLERDEGMFGYIGQLINDGGMPYRDAIDHKPPLVYFIYAFALRLVPPTAPRIHLFLQLYNFITLMALFFFAKTYARSTAAGLWTAFCFGVFSSSPFIQGYTASTEMFMLLPVSLSLLFAVQAAGSGRTVLYVLSGISGAVACMTKHTGVFIEFFIVLYMTAAVVRAPGSLYIRLKSLGRCLLLWLLGFAGVLLVIAGFFYYRGVLQECIYWGFTFNVYYGTGETLFENLPRFLRVIGSLAAGNPALIGTGVLFGVICLVKRDHRGAFLLGFLACSVLAALPGFAYKHYFAQLVPAVALAGGSGFSAFVDAFPDIKKRIVAVAVCAAAVAGIPWAVHSDYYFFSSPAELSRKYFGPNPFPEAVDAARFIAGRTDVQDTIFIFGSEAEILFYAQRKSATPFVLLYPLTRERYPNYKQYQEKAWQDIQQADPKYILIVQVPQSVLWDGKADMLLYRNVIQEVNTRYALDAIMTIDTPRGVLLPAGETPDLQEVLSRYRYYISIFRRR